MYEDIPFKFWEGTIKYLKGYLCIGVVIYTGTLVDLDYLPTKEFGALNALEQAFYLFIIYKNFTYKALTCWFFADGVNKLTGLTYGGKDKEGNHQFNRNIAVDYNTVEFGTNIRDMINSWNIQVAMWLRNYIYLRVEKGDKKRRGLATAVTFFTSAFWHGLLP